MSVQVYILIQTEVGKASGVAKAVSAIAPRLEHQCKLEYLCTYLQRRSVHEKGLKIMSVQAFILIQTEVGKASSVAKSVSAIPGVTLSEGVTGPYDVIMRAEAPSMEEFGRTILSKVQAVAGITRTLTCPVTY